MVMKNSVVVDQLSKDIQMGFRSINGFSPHKLMHQMYEEYSNPSILEQVVPELQNLKELKK